MATPKVGEEAPDFEVVARQAGEPRTIRLSDFRGKQHVVLYFYPRDFTPVCTKETCGFRDLYSELQASDTEVIGVSVDDDESHERFAAQHGVTFPLVSDPDRELAHRYGASSLFRSFLGMTSRITYVIDKQGRIAAMFDSPIRASQHVDGVREAIQKLRAAGS